MATKVIMPKLSPTMEEGQISRWLKKEGDKVSMGEPLAEIDTDKATMEMQALANGVLRKILIGEGQSAPLGQIIAVIVLRKTRPDLKVVPGQHYHYAIARHGARVEFFIDGVLALDLDDPAPLEGAQHRFVGFDNWETSVHFDNLVVRPY